MLRIALVLTLMACSSAVRATEVSLISQGVYVERGIDGSLSCDATDRMRLDIHLTSQDLQDLGTTQLERSSSGIVRFDTGAGEFMEVTIEQAVIAFTPMTRSIAMQGAHMSGGTVYLGGKVLENGDIDLQSARRLEGSSSLTSYIMPHGQPPEGQRPDGSAVGAFGHCPESQF